MQATLAAFPRLRKENNELILQMSDLDSMNNKNLILKNYASQLERFAVGINCEAYDIEIVNRMSGGMLVNQYQNHIKEFIKERRDSIEQNEIEKEKIYCEYERMMKELFKLRNKKWID